MTTASAGILLVLLCTTLEGLAQVLLKKSTSAQRLARLWLGLGGALFIIEALTYTGALRLLDVSAAYPIGSLSFVVVTLLSRWLLDERITATRWAGVGAILIGASLVAMHA